MKNKQRLNLNEWAEEDRPREKMQRKGVSALTDAELLAILIGSGSTDETAVELMRRILAYCNNNLNELGKMSVTDLCHFKGIGPAKAMTIEAASELGKRRKLSEQEERKSVQNSKDIYNYFHPIMCDLPIEEFWILLLNQATKIISRIKISSGGISQTIADPRCILREALLARASSIILCHNHPSGLARPSSQDDCLTMQLQKASATMNISLLDHVIITDGEYYSYADEGKI